MNFSLIECKDSHEIVDRYVDELLNDIGNVPFQLEFESVFSIFLLNVYVKIIYFS